MRLQSQQVDAQREQLARLSAQIEELTAQIGELTRKLGRNSRNSSLPPSADRPSNTGGGPAQQEDGGQSTSPRRRGRRGQSGRKPGGQPGRAGRTRELTDNPDDVEDHQPGECAGCGGDLTDAHEAGVVRRQVVDIPEPVAPHVIEHRLHARRCGCGHTTTAAAPPGVDAPVQYGPNVAAVAVYLVVFQHVPIERTVMMLADVCGIDVSTGWVSGQVGKAGAALAEATAAIVARLRAGRVLGVDETSVSVGGVRYWLHVARNDHFTAYFLHPCRGRDAVDEFAVLPDYDGVVVHDALAVYDGPDYATATHALCGAHLLRDLTAAAEDNPDQAWPTQAIEALLALNTLATTARDTATNMDPDAKAAQLRWFTHAITVGLANHPRAPGRKQTPTRNLLQRIDKRRAEYLRYIDDLAVPFTNNGSERDLRPAKTQQKISGCHRSKTTASHWYTIRGYISTLRKHHEPILAHLRGALTGNPWMPPAPT